MRTDLVIRTEPHQLTAFQVLGVMLDAMRHNRGVRCWLVIPEGTADNWKSRIRVVLAKQRNKIRQQVVAHNRDQRDAIFSRLFSLDFSEESTRFNDETGEIAILVMYHETLTQRRGRRLMEMLESRGIF